MSIRSAGLALGSFALACAVLLPNARASVWNAMTKITFNEPVEIPGRVLPVGTYLFVLENNQSDRNIVRIYNADQSKLYANLMTIPTYRPKWTNRTEVELVVRGQQKPEALVKWYYPGRLTGYEFLYSTRHEKEFNRDGKRYVTAGPTNAASSSTSQG
ncbi:MAG: hypothetical protein WBM24_19505 [Candidatus Sulfotelmatobacter sp.]